MSLVDVNPAPFPTFPTMMSNNGNNAFTFDGASDLHALVFQIPKTGTIDKLHYRIEARSTPVMTRRIELRTVDAATGLPNAAGSLYGSSTSITVDASTDTANTNMTAAVNCTGATLGDVVAAVFDLSAFTSGSFGLLVNALNWVGPAAPMASARYCTFPYGASNTTGSTSVSSSPMTCIALEYSGGLFVPINPGLGWVGSVSLTTVTSTGAIRRAGNKVTPSTKRRAFGFYGLVDIDGAATFRLRLASDDSILASTVVDKDLRGSSSNSMNYWRFDSAATVTLTPGTAYYITLEGGDATGGIVYNANGGVSSAMLGTQPGGTACFGVTHNGTSYTELTTANATTRYNIGLMTDQEDDGAGGGLLTHPGMSGGMRG